MSTELKSNSLTKFYTAARQGGFSKDYLAKVVLMDFSSPAGFTLLNPQNYILSEKDLLYVKSVTLPYSTTEETSQKFQNFVYKSPANNVANGQLTITFYADQFFALRNFFETVLSTQTYTTGNADTINIIIDILAEDQEPVYQFLIKGAIVLSFNSTTYGPAGTGAIQEIQVNFAYNDYETNNIFRQAVTSGQIYKYDQSAGANNLDFAARQGIGPVGPLPRHSAGLNSASTSPLQNLITGLNNISRTAQAVGGAASALRGASRAIRNR